MTKEQFKRGIDEFYAHMATEQILALIGLGEDDYFLIADEYGEHYQDCEEGILITQGKIYHFVPYETIIALTGKR